jgi:hypothetical protein
MKTWLSLPSSRLLSELLQTLDHRDGDELLVRKRDAEKSFWEISFPIGQIQELLPGKWLSMSLIRSILALNFPVLYQTTED